MFNLVPTKYTVYNFSDTLMHDKDTAVNGYCVNMVYAFRGLSDSHAARHSVHTSQSETHAATILQNLKFLLINSTKV
jgi:hypothetical protein